MAKYKLTAERVSRNHNIAPIEIEGGDVEIERAIIKLGNDNIRSRDWSYDYIVPTPTMPRTQFWFDGGRFGTGTLEWIADEAPESAAVTDPDGAPPVKANT